MNRIRKIAVVVVALASASVAQADMIGLDLDEAFVSGAFYVGIEVEGLSSDGNRLWAASNGLYEYDISGGGFSFTGSVDTIGGFGLAWDGSGLWKSSGNNYYKISPDDGSIISSFTSTTSTGSIGGLTYDNGSLWKASRPEFNKIDISTGDVIASITGFDLPGIEEGLTFDGTYLYAISYTSSFDPRIWKIDATTGALQADSFALPDGTYNGLAFDGQNLWAAGYSTQTFYRISFPTPVPEPSTLALLGIGLFGMGLARRRKQLT